jgi:hypothetical protein
MIAYKEKETNGIGALVFWDTKRSLRRVRNLSSLHGYWLDKQYIVVQSNIPIQASIS